MTPAGTARLYAAFVDTLLPGDDLFPTASETGTHGLLMERVRQRLPGGVAAVAEKLSPAGDFAALAPAERETAVRALETNEPELFNILRMAAYFAYYQSPAVIAAIRALGHDYNDAPQPDGYPMPKFDFTPGVNVPMNPRGSFKWTILMEPVDRSPLADLPLPIEEQ